MSGQVAEPQAPKEVSVLPAHDQRGDHLQVVPTLAECEAVIQRGQQAFREVGFALLAIRDHRLYLVTHATFRAYVHDRWGIGKSHAYRLMAAAVMTTSSEIKNEHQARRLIAAIEVSPIGDTDSSTEEAPSDVVNYPDEWRSLVSVMDAIDALAQRDAAHIATSVPRRRGPATAKRLRKLGTYLGRIAWLLEGNEEPK